MPFAAPATRKRTNRLGSIRLILLNRPNGLSRNDGRILRRFVARMFAHSGDKNSAIQWLERSYQRKESPLIRLAVFWDWDDLRSDPRFLDLLRRINLPQN